MASSVAVASGIIVVTCVAEHPDLIALEHVEVVGVALGAHGVQHVRVDIGENLLDLFRGHFGRDGHGDMGRSRDEVGVNATYGLITIEDEIRLGLRGANLAFVIERHAVESHARI